jgi:hypothetical protein
MDPLRTSLSYQKDPYHHVDEKRGFEMRMRQVEAMKRWVEKPVISLKGCTLTGKPSISCLEVSLSRLARLCPPVLPRVISSKAQDEGMVIIAD